MTNAYRKHLTEQQKEILKLACYPNPKICKHIFIIGVDPARSSDRTIISRIPSTTKAALLIEAARKNKININEVETI